MSGLAREVLLGRTSSATHPDDFTRVSIGHARSPSRRAARAAGAVEVTAPLVAAVEQVAVPVGERPAAASVAFSRRVRFGIRASWVVNTLLLVIKAAAFIVSGSYAVLASAVDSLVDILSQVVLAVAEYQARKWDRRFPIGRTRMAELSVLACACIMFVSTSLVIRESLGSLWEGLHGHLPSLNVDAVLFIVLGVATLLKLVLYIYCRALRKNPIMVALSEDHLNDVMSNVAAVVGAAVAGMVPRYWYADPAMALLFSLFIARNWLLICWEQGQKMIGLEAPEELMQGVTDVTTSHHPDMQLDRLTAYHHGSNTVVEVDVILPALMTVRESHDIALELQHKIEAIESVERAFVHVDYVKRSLEEHKVERNLKQGETDVMKPLPGIAPVQLTTEPVPTPPSPAADTATGTVAAVDFTHNRTTAVLPLVLPAAGGNGAAGAAAECGSRGAEGPGRSISIGSDYTTASGSTPFSSALGNSESASDIEAPGVKGEAA